MTTAPRRGGFTLIELLVVMALIAILAAIAAGAFFRVRASSEVSSTQSNLEKLNAGIDRKWKAVLDQAAIEAKNTPSSFQNACGNDPDRIRVVLTYMKLKNEFPTSVAEATNAVTFGGLTLPARTGAFGPISTFAGSADEQSAACLFLTLTNTGSGGEVFDVTPLQSQVRTINGVQMFVDSWGRPIVFLRQAYSGELDAAPYSTGAARDPLDPLNKLTGWSNLATFWGVIRNNPAQYNPGGMVPGTYTNNRNWVPTVVSFGPNESMGTLLGNPGSSTDAGNDNLISFRLRRAGMKGN